MVTADFYRTKQFLIDLFSFFDTQRWAYFRAFLLSTSGQICNLILPLLTAQMVNFLVEYTTGSSLTPLATLIVLWVSLGLYGSLAGLIGRYKAGNISRELKKKIRLKGLRKLMELDMAWHESSPSGAQMKKLYSGSQSSREFLGFICNDGSKIILSIFFSLAVFASFNSNYLIIIGVYVLLYLLIEVRLNKEISTQQYALKKKAEQESAKLYEYNSNIRTVKSLDLCRAVETRADRVLKARFKEGLKINKLGNVKWRWISTISLLTRASMMVLLSYNIIHGTLSVGMFVAYLSYFGKVQTSLNGISRYSDRVMDWKSSIRRMMTIFNEASYIENDNASKKVPDWHNLIFKNVSFSYKDRKVLDNVNLKIKKGEKVGIVGESGQGKSTLFKLFLKLYLPKSGTISLDNTDFKDIKRKHLIEHIAIVPQDTELFNTTFKENIMMARTRNSENSISYAMKVAHCEDILKKLKRGINTYIGEKGVKLSGGERQRIGIARAVYRNSEIYLFDEATSHLDSITEEKIQNDVLKALKDKTIIMIAHRLSTLKEMDRIIVFNNGHISEQGSFEELVAKRGKFYKLWQRQNLKH